ncbi:hypothetical protein [Burkholderia sp. Bp9131]|uniref:hypothetical protein n=1 Tax=Burkholderia sp. Bp9131 TaxID=2184571 RepID=UPI000F5693AC|nr:hypothetical protein [Burkholderia sp. Bp9131]
MSTVKTQKLSNTQASAKRAKGPASKTATANRDLFGGDSNTGLTAPAKRARSEPATKRATTSRASTAQQTAKAAPKRVAPSGSVRINFDLERAIHKRLKMLAVEADLTIADWMRALIQKELEHLDKMERRGK